MPTLLRALIIGFQFTFYVNYEIAWIESWVINGGNCFCEVIMPLYNNSISMFNMIMLDLNLYVA